VTLLVLELCRTKIVLFGKMLWCSCLSLIITSHIFLLHIMITICIMLLSLLLAEWLQRFIRF